MILMRWPTCVVRTIVFCILVRGGVAVFDNGRSVGDVWVWKQIQPCEENRGDLSPKGKGCGWSMNFVRENRQ